LKTSFFLFDVVSRDRSVEPEQKGDLLLPPVIFLLILYVPTLLPEHSPFPSRYMLSAYKILLPFSSGVRRRDPPHSLTHSFDTRPTHNVFVWFWVFQTRSFSSFFLLRLSPSLVSRRIGESSSVKSLSGRTHASGGLPTPSSQWRDHFLCLRKAYHPRCYLAPSASLIETGLPLSVSGFFVFPPGKVGVEFSFSSGSSILISALVEHRSGADP